MGKFVFQHPLNSLGRIESEGNGFNPARENDDVLHSAHRSLSLAAAYCRWMSAAKPN